MFVVSHYMEYIQSVKTAFKEENNTYPEILNFEPRNLMMCGSNVSHVRKECINITKPFDALIQGLHDLCGMLS